MGCGSDGVLVDGAVFGVVGVCGVFECWSGVFEWVEFAEEEEGGVDDSFGKMDIRGGGVGWYHVGREGVATRMEYGLYLLLALGRRGALMGLETVRE